MERKSGRGKSRTENLSDSFYTSETIGARKVCGFSLPKYQAHKEIIVTLRLQCRDLFDRVTPFVLRLQQSAQVLSP